MNSRMIIAGNNGATELWVGMASALGKEKVNWIVESLKHCFSSMAFVGRS